MRKKKRAITCFSSPLLISAILSALLFYGCFSEDTQETTTVSGVFNKYEEKKRRVNKSTKTFYYVFLNGTTYSIPRIYSNALKKELFLTEVKQGDSLTLKLKGPKSIYQITKAQTDYIDTKKLEEKVTSNSYVGVMLGSLFLGCIVYLIGRVYEK